MDLIKIQGDMNAKALAQALGMTAMGAGQHLNKLLEKGWVKTTVKKTGRGRPSAVWQLTASGHAQYTDRHANLTLDLIKLVELNFGEQGLEQVIQGRSQLCLDNYLEKLEGLDLVARVKRLAQLRSEEGYMARVVEQENSFLLIEDHCPICAAAKTCQGFCKTELENFQACFSQLAEVSRTEHILQGASRCCYEIKPLSVI
jgi:predicted ArsR family transcriptional regulator